MTKSRLFVAVLGSLVATTLMVSSTWAQSGPPVRSAIALIDIGVIFKNHDRFKAEMTNMQADMERAEGQMKKERDTLRAMAERINEYRVGTQEYKDLEQNIAKREADLKVNAQLQRKEFLQREAKIYNRTYQEVWQEVDAFAQANGLVAVFKFSREATDPDKPEEIMRELNKSVMWSARGLDITDDIVRSIKGRGLVGQNPPPSGPTHFPPRPSTR